MKWPSQSSGEFTARLYCYGARNGYNNDVELRVKDGGGWQSEGTRRCAYQTWTVVTWSDIDTTIGYLYFQFKLSSGFLVYGPNSNWYNAPIWIDRSPTSEDEYYHMDDIKFRNIDSCSSSLTICDIMHSEVEWESHVTFLHRYDYLLTDDFYLPDSSNTEFSWYARCLTNNCAVDMYIDGQTWKTNFQFSNSYWTYVQLGTKYLTTGYHDLRIENQEDRLGYPSDSDIVWRLGVAVYQLD